MRILVTGADGFVGRHPVAAWRESLPEAEIWGLVHEKKTVDLPTPFVCAFDLRDERGLYDRRREISPDRVVHLAAQSFVPQAFAHPQETWEVNLWGTFHLLATLRETHFPGCFLFVGSAEQYGKVDEKYLLVRESRPFRPHNAYVASKAAAELLCFQYCQSYGLTVKEFVIKAFAYADLDWQQYVVIDRRFFRPAEVEFLCADPTKARRVLHWRPEVPFDGLVRLMVETDLQRLKARL